MIPEQLKTKIWQKHIPVAMSFELTWRCNLRCIHCYQYAPCKDELTLQEIKRILDELAEAGSFFLTFTGGEPLMREDFFDIANYARKKNFAIILLTNGTLIDKDIAGRIKELGTLQVCISILGSCAKTHDSITTVPGSFEKAINAIKLLSQLGTRVFLNTMVLEQNFKEQVEIKKLAKELGVEQTLDSVVTLKNDGSKKPVKCRLSDKNLRNYFSWLNKEDSERFEAYKWGLGEPLCGASIVGCAINPKGEVLPCTGFPKIVGSLKETSFKEIWDNSEFLKKLRSLNVSDLKECSQCELQTYCFRCPAVAWLEDGDVCGPSQEACRQAKKLKEVMEK